MGTGQHKNDYVSVVYNVKDRPLTEYPDLLARYLVGRFNIPAGAKILDLGCGRGEFLRGFIRCGLDGRGVDQSMAAQSFCPEATIIRSDMEKDPLPYDPGSFDVVFSKSVLEHFYYPEKLVMEILRVLKPGGIAITMVPDWESVYRIFYEDYTHRTPFTARSLKDILLINGFSDVTVEKFRQLPFLWSSPWLGSVCSMIALVAPRSLGSCSKLIKFSQEIMLLSAAVKPGKQGEVK